MKLTAATQSQARHPGLARLQSDERLVRRAKRGDRRAFEAIFERYHQDLYRFCLTLVGSRQDAEDALQATMVKMLRALPGEARDIQLRPWIYRIARNESIDTVRRRRETVAIVPEQIAAGPGLAEAAESRERLGRLIDDLADLPERQRAALVMRELGDLEFFEIAAALETSAEAARQAVYEARVSLRQMESGRDMSCDEILWAISEADGRVIRRREIQAHIRACPDCRAFQESISRRRGELRAIAPLPVAASAAILHGALGSGSGAAGGGAAAAAGAGAGKALVSSAVVKTAATCAVVAAIGATAADRSGLVNVPLVHTGGQAAESASPPQSSSSAPTSVQPKARQHAAAVAAGRSSSKRHDSSGSAVGAGAVNHGTAGPTNGASTPPASTTVPSGGGSKRQSHGASAGAHSKSNVAKRGQGKAPGLPASSAHGQQTSTAHKSPHANGSPGTPRGVATAPPSHSQPAPEPKAQPEREAKLPPSRPTPEPPAPEKRENSVNRATGEQPELAESSE